MTDTIYLVSVCVHLLALAAWMGGGVFIAVVYVPLLKSPEWRESALRILQQSARRLTVLGWTCFALLTISGAAMLWRRGIGLEELGTREWWQGGFGKVLRHKLELVVVIFALQAVHDFWVGPRATRLMAEDPAGTTGGGLRLAARWLGRISLVLGLAVMALAAMMARGWSW